MFDLLYRLARALKRGDKDLTRWYAWEALGLAQSRGMTMFQAWDTFPLIREGCASGPEFID